MSSSLSKAESQRKIHQVGCPIFILTSSVNSHAHLIIIGMPTLLSLSDRFGFVPLNAEPAVYKDFFEEMQYFIELNGPFDGLIGFSEGASIAITLLIEDARSSFAKFKCAVLFCTLKTVDLASLDQDSGSGDKLCFLERDERDVESEYPIKIPTAHIWSNTDDVACGASEKAMRLCEQAFVESLVHDLGHDIPGSHTDKFVAETVNIVERTIERGKEISVP